MDNPPTSNNFPTLTIIDTFGFLFRSYYALPPLKDKATGFPTGLLTGFINMIYALGKDYDSSYILFALDSKGDSFRNEIFPAYKANRPQPPEELTKQIPVAIEWIEKMGFKSLSKEGFEADDIICSLVKMGEKNGFKMRIVSHDKDLNQLINAHTTLFDPAKKSVFDTAACFEKFGVYPEQFIDYQAIVGDSSDNVPGVKGIGAKGASGLLQKYSSLEEIFEHIDELKGRQKELLQASQEVAFMSKQLVTLRDDLFTDMDLSSFTYPKENPILKIEQELRDLGITAILDKIPTQGMYVKTTTPIQTSLLQEGRKTFKAITLDDEESLYRIIDTIPQEAIIAFDTETDSLESNTANIVGFSFCFEATNAYYVPIAHISLENPKQISKECAKRAIQKLFTHHIIGHNLKFDWHILYHNFGIEDIPHFSDTIIMAWLINPVQEKSLDALSQSYLNHTTIKLKSLIPKNGSFAQVPINKATSYASEDAWATLQLYHQLNKEIDPHLLELAQEIEYPFMKTILLMERNGIQLDIAFLKAFDVTTKDRIKALIDEIHTLIGADFNINSPQQLRVILFEKLALPTQGIKKTKTGYSTDEGSLTELIGTHPAIEKILEYREIYKLQSTYIEPLIKSASQDSEQKIHTNFVQIGTSTGRLSSNTPNLQNIPVRTDLGKTIRGGFIADEGHKLIGIDYSQIELRLLAHFSEDNYLREAFVNGQDIHLQTAIKLFGEEVAHEKRSIAKSINFGILYGMGSRKLAKMLRIPAKEAKEYIDSYFDSFVCVKDCIEGIKNDMQQNGFVETLLKRRRYFDFSRATPFERSNYLREGVNAVFQGSAADLIKLSMNKINATFNNIDAKILVQIHDEILIQAPYDKVETIANTCQHIMEHIMPLKVPLKTSVHIGSNWLVLK